jgi:hypothetical protein
MLLMLSIKGPGAWSADRVLADRAQTERW